MSEKNEHSVRALFIDKDPFRQIVAERSVEMGLVPDPTATAEKAQEMMLALGIRLEDNLFSSAIIADRDEA